jgi:predicted metal-dependent hydrolase
MQASSHQILVDGLRVDVVRKDIKNLHLAVYPPDGRVRVAAPLLIDDEAVRLAVILRLGWIRKQQARFAAQARQSPREYVSGESHYYLGTRYRLRVVAADGPAHVRVIGKRTIELAVRPGSTEEQRRRVYAGWQRQQLRVLAAPLFARWEPLMGVQVAEWGIKQMKTRWGTCNPDARRIWLNLELIKHPPACIEYVVVHEMVHLLERGHTEQFRQHMTRFLPQWRTLREELARGVLGSEVD